jgi:hypothetical protein
VGREPQKRGLECPSRSDAMVMRASFVGPAGMPARKTTASAPCSPDIHGLWRRWRFGCSVVNCGSHAILQIIIRNYPVDILRNMP